MEHRWGERRTANQEVYLLARSGLAAKGCIRDVSVSGAYIESPLPIPLYSFVRVHFATRAPSVAAEGQVVRRTADGFGIEWSELAPDVIQLLMEPTSVDSSRAANTG